MKKAKKTPEALFGKDTISRLPEWAKTFIAVVSLALVPLLDVVFRLVAVNQLANVLEKFLKP